MTEPAKKIRCTNPVKKQQTVFLKYFQTRIYSARTLFTGFAIPERIS
jgi:hypothetical protein